MGYHTEIINFGLTKFEYSQSILSGGYGKYTNSKIYAAVNVLVLSVADIMLTSRPHKLVFKIFNNSKI